MTRKEPRLSRRAPVRSPAWGGEPQSQRLSSDQAEARPNRRASPDVVEKRRAARHFNDILLGRGARTGLDGRTEKRRQRLLQELADGVARGDKHELKPIDVLARVQALLNLGEPLASIRRACPLRRPVEVTPEIVDGVRRLHQAYGFAPETYRFVGIDPATLRRAGVLPEERPPKAPRADEVENPLRPLARPALRRPRGAGATEVTAAGLRAPTDAGPCDGSSRHGRTLSGKRRGVA